jgi:hypothetical protein
MQPLWKGHRGGEEVDESIAVVGLGNVKLHLAAVIANGGLRVVGVDVNSLVRACSLLVPSVISILHAIEYWFGSSLLTFHDT